MLFEDAKPGDVVAVPYSDGDVKARVVAKVTATQVVLENGDRYRRDDGHGIKVQGHAKPWTEAHDARHRRYVAGVRLREAAIALHRLTSVGSYAGPRYMPSAADVPAADALADAIEKYLAAPLTVDGASPA